MEGREGLAGRPQRGRGQAGSAPPSRSPWEEPLPIPLEDTLDLHAFAPREVESVVADVLDGFVTAAGALSDYGVAVDPDTGDVDAEATSALRARPSGAGSFIDRGLVDEALLERSSVT